MRNRKLERALYGPTIYEITLGLLLSVALGAALAIVFLIFKPAEVVKEMPKEDARIQGMTYYLAGSADAAKAKQWMRKRQMVLESTPGEVSITEDDLNVCLLTTTEAGKKSAERAAAKAAADAAVTAAAKAPPPKPAKPGAPAPAPAPAPEVAPVAQQPTELITYDVANFRIHNNIVQLGVPTTINTLGYTFPVVTQVRGGFEKQGDMYAFVPDEVMIGSLPLHRFPHAVEYLMQRIMASDALPPDLMAAWKKVKTVVVDGNAIKLTI